MKDNRTITRLFWTIAGAVALIALGSFVWSFFALWSLAEQNSTQAGLGWIWPLIVDLSMVIYTGGILVAQLQRRPAKLPIALTVFYSLVTITGNVLHAPETPLGWFVAILPPLSLVFGTEMLRTMGHHIIERGATVSTLAELVQQIDQTRSSLAEALAAKEGELSRLNGQIEQAATKLEQLRADQKAVKVVQMEELNKARFAKIEQRRAEVLNLVREGMTPRAIADELRVSVSTVKRDIGQLNGKVKVSI